MNADIRRWRRLIGDSQLLLEGALCILVQSLFIVTLEGYY